MNSIIDQVEKMVVAAMPVIEQIATSLRQGVTTAPGYERLSLTLLTHLPPTASVHEAFALGYVASHKVDLKLAELVADA